MTRPRIDKAFIWAAGLGTRLRPYTNETPKPLLPVSGRPIIEYILRFLASVNIRDITINTWHLADQFETLLDLEPDLNVTINLSRQPQRFEHAGDLAYSRTFLNRLHPDETFIALNGDTLFCVPDSSLSEAGGMTDAASPLVILAHRSDKNPLHVHNDVLVGINSTCYVSAFHPTHHLDDFGIKFIHASVREFLPRQPQVMPLHGKNGLIGILTADGKTVRVLQSEGAERAEIGTVSDYENYHSDPVVSRLVARLTSSH